MARVRGNEDKNLLLLLLLNKVVSMICKERGVKKEGGLRHLLAQE